LSGDAALNCQYAVVYFQVTLPSAINDAIFYYQVMLSATYEAMFSSTL
jgi:hypothetical protein